MTDIENLSELECRIGYVFKDKSLFETALTHSSYANEHCCESNERLEFLGDSILNYIVSERLYFFGKNVGEMTDERKGIVSKYPLACAVRKIGAEKFLRANISGKVSEKLISDIFEAVVGAIYVDSGSLNACEKFITDNLDFDNTLSDYKTLLQEYVQKHKLGAIVYNTKESDSEDFTFCSEVLLDNVRLGCGVGGQKKEAEKAAAKEAYIFLTSRS